jgi:LacI family transcriptional regulator
MIERVNVVVRKLRFRRGPAPTRRARARRCSSSVVLLDGSNSFITLREKRFHRVRPLRFEDCTSAHIEVVDVHSTVAIAPQLADLHGWRDVVVTALDYLGVRAATDHVVASGTLVASLVSGVPASRRGQGVGIDSVAALRTAGNPSVRFVGASKPGAGRVGVVLGRPALCDRAERLFGFQQVIAAEHARIRLWAAIEGNDDSAKTRPLTARLLEFECERAAVCCTGAAKGGIHADSKASGRACEIVWVWPRNDCGRAPRPAERRGRRRHQPGRRPRNALRRVFDPGAPGWQMVDVETVAHPHRHFRQAQPATSLPVGAPVGRAFDGASL